jgi:hypothetical protein
MPSAPRGLVARPATYAGLFVVTLSTLAYEIVLTRIFSVTMWYHFAFVAISVALFGTTLGALIVHMRPSAFTEDKVKVQMARFSLVYAVAVAVAFVAQLAVPFRIELDAVALFSLVFICAVISVPFVCAGVVVCLALTKFPDKVNRLYAADLVGAGLGCLVLVAAFLWFDGPSLVILIAAIAAVGAFLFALDAKGRKLQLLAAVTMVVLLLGSVGNSLLASNRHEGFLKIRWAKEGEPDQPDGQPHLQERWNAFSRVTVDGNPDELRPPFGNGLSTRCPQEDMAVRQLNMVIDSAAGTVMTGYSGNPDETNFLRCDISNVVYHALEGEDFDQAAVVGVGGGRDVLSALEFDVGHVTGVEINGNILDIVNDTYGDFTGHLDRNPAVSFANDEARSWLTRTDTRFDSIQISLIDTWAATAAGAFALSENSLYTTDAWETFLDRLQPGGMLSVSRWFTTGNDEPLEVLRTTALASQVLHDRGVENPRDHIVVLEGPPQGPFGFTVGTVLVSPEPFTEDVLQRIDDVVDRYEFTPILTPDEATDQWDFAGLVEPGGPGSAIERFEADISAPTDNRPFFFQMADLTDVLGGNLDGDRQEFEPVVTLSALGLAVLLIAAVSIGGPLVQIGRRTSHRGNVPYYLYFCGIGLAFLMVEISQMMRLSTFLGHPTYALVVVLFTVLLFSGLGSMLVDRITSLARPRSLVVPLLALLGLAVVFGMLTPRLIDSMDGATTPTRIGVAIGIMAPLAFLMGMPFSLGMRMASTKDDAPTAFLWGINGAMSVVASVFATVLALFFGIAVTFFTGVAAYGLAAAAMVVLVRRHEALTAAPADGDGQQADGNGASSDADEPAEAEDADEADAEPAIAPAAT